MGGGGVQYEASEFKTILSWKLMQKSWPTFLCYQEIGCVLFMRGSRSVIINLGHWKEELSEAPPSVVPRLFTLPPLVNEWAATPNQSRSIMLTGPQTGMKWLLRLSQSCAAHSSFRARRTSEKAPVTPSHR